MSRLFKEQVTLDHVCTMLAASEFAPIQKERFQRGDWMDFQGDNASITYFRDSIHGDPARIIETFRAEAFIVNGKRHEMMLDVTLIDDTTKHVTFGPESFRPFEITPEMHRAIVPCVQALRTAYESADNSSEH